LKSRSEIFLLVLFFEEMGLNRICDQVAVRFPQFDFFFILRPEKYDSFTDGATLLVLLTTQNL